MTPANIVGMSALKDLDVIALTDHNSCRNCPPLMHLAEQNNIIAIPGMELCTMEEVHVLCLFENLADALCFDEFVAGKLIRIPNDENIFGKQVVCDERDQVIGTLPYLLINATEISFDHLEEIMKKFHGMYIPAHIDKNANSLLSNLGFIPPDSKFRCAEVKDTKQLEELYQRNPYLKQCNIISDSDAHSLGLINEPIHFLEVEGRSRKDVLNALMKVR